MAFVSTLRRNAVVLLVSAALAACSGSMVPPADIDGENTVSAIMPEREGRRSAAIDMMDASGTYPAPEVPVAGAGQSMPEPISPERGGYPDAPDPAAAGAGERDRLPKIDSDEALGLGQPAEGPAGGSLHIPDDGVNMDRELGVEPVQGLAEEQAGEIAEGNAAHVVVDGIGSENPQQLGEPAAIPMSEAGPEVGLPAADGGGIQSEPEGRAPVRSGGEQVAFIPRLSNPMSVPETMGGMPASERACRQQLQRLGVQFRDIPRISRGRSCGIAYPIELTGLSGGIQIKPAAKVNCQITEAFAKWVKNELAPAARYRYLSGVKSIHQMSSYSCRTMNSRRGNPMSEHAKGNAIDVGKIVLKNGKEIAVRRKGFFAFREKGLLKAVRSDSCKYFTTVLGPGSDRYHKDHFHFDLRERRSGYRHCSL
ncbi:MAG: extensin family protein [Shinella sp.]|nr:extensin family protein [Shinella sp.]